MFVVGHRGLEPRKALALNEVAVPICISQRPTLYCSGASGGTRTRPPFALEEQCSVIELQTQITLLCGASSNSNPEA
jgi:hypothetical protein